MACTITHTYHSLIASYPVYWFVGVVLGGASLPSFLLSGRILPWGEQSTGSGSRTDTRVGMRENSLGMRRSTNLGVVLMGVLGASEELSCRKVLDLLTGTGGGFPPASLGDVSRVGE